MILPQCSEPNDAWPPQINACLRDIQRYRKQLLDPMGYRKELIDIEERAKAKAIKGSKEGGKKE